MAKARLTKMQRRILCDMLDGEPHTFTGDMARNFGYRRAPLGDGSFMIRAYGAPNYFLKGRGLIEPCEGPRNQEWGWYRITEAGKEAVRA